ncbi:hypothetical protein Tco_1160819, partial [Tanacetum coccineum]
MDQNDQNDHPVQADEILTDDQLQHSNYNNENHIIDNLLNTEDVQITEPLSSPTKATSALNATLIPTGPSLSIPSMASQAPHDRWSKDKHIELVKIIAHECLFVNFLSEEEPKKVSEALKHPGWVDVMQEELNQFARNKVPERYVVPTGRVKVPAG